MIARAESSEAWGDCPPEAEVFLFIPAIEHWNRRVEEMNQKEIKGHEPATFLDKQAVPARHISIKALEASRNYAMSVIKDPADHKKEIAAATITVGALLALTRALHVRRKK